jgi:cytochrome c oxidase cbb3-type subunit 4
MDINDFRTGFTVLSLVLFLGIMAWTWSRRRQDGFEEAAQLPFQEIESNEQAGERQ